MFIAVEEIFERAVTDLSDEPGSCAGASGRPGARWDSGISPQIRQKYTLASQQGDHPAFDQGWTSPKKSSLSGFSP